MEVVEEEVAARACKGGAKYLLGTIYNICKRDANRKED